MKKVIYVLVAFICLSSISFIASAQLGNKDSLNVFMHNVPSGGGSGVSTTKYAEAQAARIIAEAKVKEMEQEKADAKEAARQKELDDLHTQLNAEKSKSKSASDTPPAVSGNGLTLGDWLLIILLLGVGGVILWLANRKSTSTTTNNNNYSAFDQQRCLDRDRADNDLRLREQAAAHDAALLQIQSNSERSTVIRSGNFLFSDNYNPNAMSVMMKFGPQAGQMIHVHNHYTTPAPAATPATAPAAAPAATTPAAATT